ncbi:hypothetical protein BDR26DRAFT_709083 [Obelidium mucronatum]|nr:hypothetical protein BDR26DRAFT_709083 [Obelidium mucronatum]
MAIYITGVLFEVCYVLSGWRRSDMVVKRLLPDYHLKLDIALRLTCILYVVAGFLQTLSNMMPLEQEDTSMMLNRIGIVMALAAILLMGCFDVFLLVCFMVFLNKTRFGLTTEPRFVIIARFGILGSLVYVSLPWIYFNALVLGNMESMTATPIIYLVLFLVMFVLKVFLYFDSKKESSSVKS